MKIHVAAVSIRVAERPPVGERAVYSVYCACLSERLSISFPFGFEGGIWDLLIRDLFVPSDTDRL